MIRNVAVAPNHRIFKHARDFGWIPHDTTYVSEHYQLQGFESNRLVIWEIWFADRQAWKIHTAKPEVLEMVNIHARQGALVHSVESP